MFGWHGGFPRLRLLSALVVAALLVIGGAAGAATNDDYVLLLGVGSADGTPSTHLTSSVFFPPDLIIDFCCMYEQDGTPKHLGRLGLTRNNISVKSINHLLITHSHADHFDAVETWWLAWDRYRAGASGNLHVYGNPTIINALQNYINQQGNPRITLHTIHQFDEFTAGQWNCKAMAAVHDAAQECLFYVLRRNGKSVLYATDTDVFPASTFTALALEQLDVAIVECTWYTQNANTHLNLSELLSVRSTLLQQGSLKPNAKFCLTHTNLNSWGNSLYDTVRRAEIAGLGMILPVDGLRLDLATSRTMAEIKQMNDNYVVGVRDVGIIGAGGAVGPGFFYAGAANRTAGIRAEGSNALATTGNRVDLVGILATSGLERKLTFPVLTQISPVVPVDPLYMSNRWVGGSSVGLALGVTGGVGPNNVGMLVTVSGAVTSSSGNDFFISDGSGAPLRCRGASGMTIPQSGFVSVTGVVSLIESGGQRLPVVLVRSQQDIR